MDPEAAPALDEASAERRPVGQSALAREARAARRREEAAMSPLERVKLALRLGLYTRELAKRAGR